MSVSWNNFIKDLMCDRYEINGHSTDFSQVGRHLTEMVKRQYPINEVPEKVATALKDLNGCLTIAGDTYEEVLDLIITEVKKQQAPDQPPPKTFEE